MRRWFLPFAILILLVAALLRIVGLHAYPPGPHYDEAANLIITRTIAFGGARYFPMVENYQGREVLYYYLSTPFLMMIHDSRFALQLVGVFSNLMMIAAAMNLAKTMFSGRRGITIALAVGVAAAISIPQILLARQAFRAITLPLMQTLTLLFLWHGLKTTRWKSGMLLLTAGVLGGMTVYTYNSSRLFPVWLALAGVVLLIFSRGERGLRWRQGAMFFSALIMFALPFAIYGIRKPDIFFGRLYEVTGGADAITLGESIWLHAKMFFIQGEALLRYNPPGRPYFTLPEGGLLLTGVIASIGIIFSKKPALERVATVLVLISPLMIIPSVISTSGFPPNHMRSVAMVPLIFVLLGLGFDRVTQWIRQERIVYGAIFAALLVGGIYSGHDYYAWVTRADLYYDTDADLAAAANWLADIDDTVVYVAAQDRYHPTVQVFDTPSVRWLGRDTLFLPPAGESRVVIFPRSAPPPDDWREWFTQQAVLIDDLPLAPDGRAAFEAVRLMPDMTLPPHLQATTGNRIQNNILTLSANYTGSAFPNGKVDIVTAWRINVVPDQQDVTPILHVEDSLGNVLARGEVFSVGTDTWEVGEMLLQRIPDIRLPVGTPPGNYSLKMAWVARERDDYLPYIDETGAFSGVWAEVGTLEILRSNEFPPASDLPVEVLANIDVADGVRLIGWDTLPESVRPGEILPITLYWQGTDSIYKYKINYNIIIDNNVVTSLAISAPTLQNNPSDEWLTGQLITDRIEAAIPHDQTSGEYTLVLRVGNQDIIIGLLNITGVARNFSPPRIDNVVQEDFDDILQLYGYRFSRSDVAQLKTIWYTKKTITNNYKIFIHLVDKSGEIIWQEDGIPVNGTYPTSLWLPTEYITDTHILSITPEVVAIRIGLYLEENGTRLVTDSGADFFEINITKYDKITEDSIAVK